MIQILRAAINPDCYCRGTYYRQYLQVQLKAPYFKKFSIVLALLFPSFVVLSQDYNQQYVKRKLFSGFELVGGLGTLKNSGYYEAGNQTKYGKSYGVGVYHTFAKSFDLNFRVLREFKGNKVSYNIDEVKKGSTTHVEETYNINSDFTYLTFSLLPTFRIGHQKNIMLGLGGSYSHLQKAFVKNEIVDHTNQTTTTMTNNTMSNFLPKYDYGICLFAGYSISITERNKCSIQIMYNKGFVDQEDFWNEYFDNGSVFLMLSFSFANEFGKRSIY